MKVKIQGFWNNILIILCHLSHWIKINFWKNVLFNESKNGFEEKRKKFCHKKGELKMKIYTSPNQNLIEFVFIGVFVCGKVSWGEEID